MFVKKARTVKSFSLRLKAFAVPLLLFLYIAGNVQFESFHQIFHSFEEISHSIQEEQDPCHRTIYHDSKSEGCDHETHITAVKNCPLCHVVPFNEQHLSTSNSFISIFSPDLFHDYESEGNSAYPLIDLPTRGPPLL
jgi:hypothetical protein